ncbi:conserved hypothetical protein [Trichinella spiralis]|uniref:hypothetical protein n=1 Tax=Trichinella spiralis TaxID=6334 RepID=UPI0001EFD717|nr:conserved hypothetical protein [Trichinella spiralis]
MGKLANNGHAGQLPRAKVSGWSATLTSSSRRVVVRSDRSRDLHLGSGYHWASVSSLSGGLVRPLAGAQWSPQKKTPSTRFLPFIHSKLVLVSFVLFTCSCAVCCFIRLAVY